MSPMGKNTQNNKKWPSEARRRLGPYGPFAEDAWGNEPYGRNEPYEPYETYGKKHTKQQKIAERSEAEKKRRERREQSRLASPDGDPAVGRSEAEKSDESDESKAAERSEEEQKRGEKKEVRKFTFLS